MEPTQELDDREFDAFAMKYRTPKQNIPVIKRYFALVADGEEGEHFECRYCNRRFSVAEVFLIIDPAILAEHPVKGFDWTRAEYGSPTYWKHQCALTDPEPQP